MSESLSLRSRVLVTAGLSTVLALAVSGPDLYAGGYFTMADGTNANYIAKWDGSSWLPLGSGMTGFGLIPFVSSLPSQEKVFVEPHLNATLGVPQAIDSIIVRPNGSGQSMGKR